MAAERLIMRQVREVLRLKWEQRYSDRKVALACHLSRPAIKTTVARALAAGLSWPLPSALDDVALERVLFPPPLASTPSRPLPNFAEVHQELRRKGVTLQLLWEEYKANVPDGLQYSQYCVRYRARAGHLQLTMRQAHRAGEKCFVDYAGQTVPVIDPRTGEVRAAQVFVACGGHRVRNSIRARLGP